MTKVVLNDKSIRRAPPPSGQIELWDSYLPGFGLRISAGGSRTYFVMRRVSGKMVRRSVAKAPPPESQPGDRLANGELWPADARDRARTLLNELARGIDTKREEKDAADLVKLELAAAEARAADAARRTFAAVAAAYFADTSKRGGARLRTLAELQRKVRVDLADWADKPIESITRSDVKAKLREKALTSPVSANRLLALIRRILRWAAREDLISANPAWEVDAPTEEVERDRVLTLQELTSIWKAADALGYPFGGLTKLLILTAQRRGEIAGLRWSEIDGMVWKLPDDRAKRGKGHLVPLSPLALDVLNALPRLDGPSGFVFTTGRRKPGTTIEAEPVPVAGWSRAKRRLDDLIAAAAAKENGVSHEDLTKPEKLAAYRLADWTLHDIRRSVSTHLRDSEVMGPSRVDRLTVSKILNHAEGGMTRIYDRYSADPEKRQALDAWSDRVKRLLGLNIIDLAAGATCAS